MMRATTYTLIATATLGLAACGTSGLEAGSQLDSGYFGNATMHNMMAQKCSGQGKGYIVPDPVVVLDPSSHAAKPVYRRAHIQCSGRLDGKYARIIYREYVNSAVPLPVGAEVIQRTGG